MRTHAQAEGPTLLVDAPPALQVSCGGSKPWPRCPSRSRDPLGLQGERGEGNTKLLLHRPFAERAGRDSRNLQVIDEKCCAATPDTGEDAEASSEDSPSARNLES